MDVNISHLRQHFPDYLDRVRQGERIRVMSRGRVVAEIVPPDAALDDPAAPRARLKGSLVRYDDPIAPVLAD